MPDIIQLLPDSVANQIAAGEVVQRPASAVKELLENAIDSGASEIQLIVKDAGKTLIQVIDNGCGMTETDARLSFERHATSKIRQADELYKIKTKGFRGEALASIAAIAHVELKTRLRDNEIGTKILISGSEVENQEPCATQLGTSISVKNLYFNTPARRNFLKSDSVEMRHIVEEFERVALAHSDISFSLKHNQSELFNLKESTIRQRIVNMFGPKFNERLVPVKEETAIVRVNGFIGKPEYAKKTRGEQYFFVNNRFIKNSYLHHAVLNAFDDLINYGSYPAYFLYLDLDPATIDVNIHPTKTEIKFTEERSIYAIIHSAVRNSLGKYNISPSLDFDQEDVFNVAPLPKNVEIGLPQSVDLTFNPFETEAGSPKKTSSSGHKQSSPQIAGWDELYKISEKNFDQQTEILEDEDHLSQDFQIARSYIQLQSRYILTTIKSGMLVVDQQRAHERVLYEWALNLMNNQTSPSQQQLFPESIELSAHDCQLLQGLQEDLSSLGFTIDSFGKNSVVINGIPVDAVNYSIKELIEGILEQYKNEVGDIKSVSRTALAKSLARSMSIKRGRTMQTQEMLELIDALFACDQPQLSPGGKPAILQFTIDELNEKFKF